MSMELYSETLMSWLEDPGAEEWEGLDLRKLKTDEAYVVPSTAMNNISLYLLSDDCYRCPFELQSTFGSNSSEPWIMSTRFGQTWRLVHAVADKYMASRNRSGLLCELRPDIGQFGVYHLNVTSAAGCDLSTTKEPVNILLPLLLVALVLAGVGVTYAACSLVASYVRKKRKLRNRDKELATQQRLRGLDTFRGLVVVVMIFVNCGGGGYGWMAHVTWNGLHVADCVFPCFVWIMGVCIPLTVNGVFSKGLPKWKAALRIFRRSFLLILFGVIINVFFETHISKVRIMGVLQRLGISYLVVATFYLMTVKKYFTHPRVLKDQWSMVWCWLLAAVFLILHTVISLQIHDHECPRGYTGPGGKHNDFEAPNCTGGAAGYIDRLLLGDNHLYRWHDIKDVYGASLNFDSSNILGCLTTFVHVILGLQAGATLLHYKSHHSRVTRWLAWGVMLALMGAILAGFSKERGIIPINKNLWSISFVFVMSAFSCVLLSVIYLFTDAWGLWSGAPFHAPGLNAVLLYIGQKICLDLFPFRWNIPPMRTHFMLLVENLWATLLWTIIAHIMARKQIFITL